MHHINLTVEFLSLAQGVLPASALAASVASKLARHLQYCPSGLSEPRLNESMRGFRGLASSPNATHAHVISELQRLIEWATISRDKPTVDDQFVIFIVLPTQNGTSEHVHSVGS